MNHLALKTSLVAVALSTAACQCVTGPDLDIEPVPMAATYDEATYAEGLKRQAPIVQENPANVKEEFLAVVNTNMVNFPFDSAALGKDDQEALQAIAKFVKENNVQSLTVEGHCDERGTREYNLALGDRRAVAVKKYLVGLGVDAKGITTVSFGKERPLNTAHNDKAWAENRRAVVKLN